jgi:GT2 family glycosyltransferase
MSARLVAVVPSLGEAPGLAGTLERLRAELAATAGELVWVHQGPREPPRLDRPGETLLVLPRPAGFARAVDAGLVAAGPAERVAVVNDDLAPEPGWLATLAAALDADPGLAAVQGVHLAPGVPALTDGCGMAWNRWWQAVQVGRGEPPPAASAEPFEVFGVSATGALYRRAALAAVAFADGTVFDARLDSWYEDVDLAVRLRAAGWRALCVPAARAVHAGSATGRRRPFLQARRVAGNRWLVVARLLGRALPAALPRLAARDLADLTRALARFEGARAAAIPAGWLAAVRRLGAFARLGAPLVGREELARLRVGSPR